MRAFIGQNNPRCHHIHWQNGIQEFIFTESSSQAVDEWITHIDRSLEMGIVPKLILFDISQSGLQPLPYFFARTEYVRRKYARFVQGVEFRVAVLHDHAVLMNIINTYIKFLNLPIELRYFKSIQRQEALDWLLANDKG